MEKNVGPLDAALRVVLGCVLIYIGLFVMNGRRGNLLGILVALCAGLPFYMAATRRCFVFRWFRISSVPRKNREG